MVKYLISKGIASKRLEAKGYGETQPLTTNTDAVSRKKNRRIEFLVLND